MPAHRTQLAFRPRTLVAGLALACALALAVAGARSAQASPLDGNGMWIWYVSRSGGSAEAIAKKANKRNIDLVLIKSSDADNYWSQFSPELVDAIQDAGPRVCAWQFVYGRGARKEARKGVQAVRNGADCLVIDAESHYEGRYRAAHRYIDELRDGIAKDYPVALASFPYVDYHPSFPYSVFLGKNGAQYNAPQMYWKTIGTSVRKVYAHTYEVNAPYDRPIFPLGQTYLNPSRKSIIKFRKQAKKYDSDGVSWWSWQETKGKEWRWVGKQLNGDQPTASASRSGASAGFADLEQGAAGDLVVWAQQLLEAHRHAVEIDGTYGAETATVVRAFQAERGLAPSGTVDDATWTQLLTRKPEPVNWSRRGSPAYASEPESASMEALRFEVPMTPGRP
jgi:hypothetical protein